MSSDKHPTLQKIRLGWILAGRLDSTTSTASKIYSFDASVTNAELYERQSCLANGRLGLDRRETS